MPAAINKLSIPRPQRKPDAPSTLDDPVIDAAQARKLTAAKLEWLAHVTSFRPHLSVLALCIAIRWVLYYVAKRDGRETFNLEGKLAVNVGQKRLAQELGVTRQAVAKAIRTLKDLGLIQLIARGGLGRGHSDKFVLIKRNLSWLPFYQRQKRATRRPERATRRHWKGQPRRQKRATS